MNFFGSHMGSKGEFLQAMKFVESGEIKPLPSQAVPLKDAADRPEDHRGRRRDGQDGPHPRPCLMSDTLLVRSALFVPAIRERFIEKAPDAGADMVCLDLEDSVALAEKPKGREMARDSMPRMRRTGYLMAVRVNSLQSGFIEDDLDAVVIPDLQAIGLPKADDPEIIKRVDHYLTILEKTRGIPVGQVQIFPWIETAQGLINAHGLMHCLGTGDSGIGRGGGPDLRHGDGEDPGRPGVGVRA